MTKAEKFMSDAPCHYKADEACAWAAGYNACLADVPQSSVGALEALANMFSESVHETWRKEEIVNIIEDAIRLGSPHTRPLRRPLCSKCGLEDGACICAHLPRPDTSGNRKSET